jgi:multiple sugar transport system ATP-binding protein
VFLFDEPLSNLDAALRGQMRVEIADLHARLGATMVYVTHDQVEAMTMADRIVVLNEGRIEQQGAPLELYHNPENLFVAGFLGAPRMNLLPAIVREMSPGRVVVEVAGAGQVALPVEAGQLRVGDAVTFGIRPHDLRLEATEHQLPVEVSLIEPLGGQTIVYGTAAGTRITVALPGDAAIRPRSSARFHFNAADCHLFDAGGTACRRLAAPHPLPEPA